MPAWAAVYLGELYRGKKEGNMRFALHRQSPGCSYICRHNDVGTMEKKINQEQKVSCRSRSIAIQHLPIVYITLAVQKKKKKKRSGQRRKTEKIRTLNLLKQN